MNIVYEEATEKDAYGISYVSAHSWKETYTGLLPEDYLEDRILNIGNKVEKTKSFLNNYNGKYIVAKHDGNVVGILAFCPSKNEKYKDYGYLNAIYVLKKYQKMGIGKELFKIAVEGLIKMGYKKMMLECMTGNDTLNFYKKYLGVVDEKIDFPIKRVGTVKADVLLFENLEEVLLVLNGNTKKR